MSLPSIVVGKAVKKRTFFFLIALLFSVSLVYATENKATFTLNAHVRGITVHGFIEPLPGDDPNDGLSILMALLTGEEFEDLGGPAVPMLKGQDLSLGYGDIDDFDFGDPIVGVAYYVFLSNMASSMNVSFTVSDFAHDLEESIKVSWELGVETVNAEALTIAEGNKESGTTAHPIITTPDPLKIRWAILELSLYFDEDAGYISGDYTATVVANITAS